MSKDTIYRQAAIDEITEYGSGDTIYMSVVELKRRIEHLPPAQPEPEWIPCSERLPEEMGTYLVTLEYKEHGIGVTTLWFHGPSIGWDLRVADTVTAWMPLPEAYRGDE